MMSVERGGDSLCMADKRKIGKYIRSNQSGGLEVRRVKFNGDGTISMFVVWRSAANVLFGDWRFAGWEDDYYHLIS